MNLTWKTALQAANVLVFQHTGEYLSDVETIILHGAWNNYTYAEIAEAEGYTSSYLCRDIGCKLWENLSTALKVKVSKTNFRVALKREWRKYTQAILGQNRNQLGQLLSTDNISLFEGLVALGSTFYIERCVPLDLCEARKDASSPSFYRAQKSIETICYEEIAKPGSLIRICGAKWMGKTFLLDRILEQGSLHGQRTVYLDFNSVDSEIIQDTDQLLRWLSIVVSHQLKIENKVQYYWHKKSSDYNNNCTTYFEDYVLTKIKSDIVLALDNIDRLFGDGEKIEALLKLLRNWHKKGKVHYHWSRFKIIVTHSTKANIAPKIDNLLTDIEPLFILEEFSFQQVKILASFYQLDWNSLEISRLMNEVGGHPYFVRLAMYQAKIKNIALRR